MYLTLKISMRTVLSLLILCLMACGDNEPDLQSLSGTTIEFETEITVSITLPQDLARDLEVVTAEGMKPGANNRVEATITFRNKGTTDRRLLVVGEWQDAAAHGFGGQSSVLLIAKGKTATFASGSQSRGITKFSVLVKPGTETVEQHLDSTLANLPAQVVGQGIAYTDTPTLDVVPAWAVRGVANGEVFHARTIFFSPFLGAWKLELYDRDFDPLKGTALAKSNLPGMQSIHINLPALPSRGAVFERLLNYGGGYFQIKQASAGKGTTSWNTEIAWVIEISDWHREPWLESKGLFQRGGSVTGKLYICFKGGGQGIKNSWVSGEFTDVPIVYYGAPGLDSSP